MNQPCRAFYPINPSGIAVGPADGMSAFSGGRTLDRPLFDDGVSALRALAENTDGLAIVNTNDLLGGAKRIVDDLSSYYLLGYYSTGKLDGRFHPITVRVKRPGVQVRARRGYLASTPRDAGKTATVPAASSTKMAGVEPAEAAAAHVLESAIAPLAGTLRIPLRLNRSRMETR